MNYLLLGFGVSNQSCAKILKKNNQEFYIWDDQEDKQDLILKSKYNLFDANQHKVDKIVLSPGIRYHKFLNLVKKNNITHEIDVFFKFSKNKKIRIGCTGSFGKSTTVSLIAHILNFNGIPSRAVGNIGIGLNELQDNEIPIIELSSFQLEITKIKLDIGAILNIRPHHLEFYNSYQEYCDAKLNISDLSEKIFIGEDVLRNMKNALDNLKITRQNTINYSIPDELSQFCHISKESLIAAYQICRELEISDQNIINACKAFQLLEHRQEIINSNPLIINDSKSTNLECSNYLTKKHKNIFWIAGGKKSEISKYALKSIPVQNIKHAFLVGENRHELNSIFTNMNIPCSVYENLEDAIKNLQKKMKDEVVIFSPGFQSFDSYENFQSRGKEFKNLALEHIL
ncbi:UDP-N-acetylmuramoyl-L-alanine--D-glutamate ligase [Candidatus Cytomitobacter indipagum]|uniref:UDP-N-acetylmuramoyl-L-alanine--D-glutamate ligase n=1 Tax=Candidatus Cytomitobacter indipagum TaxID=2601575 RepID=A0A5C0UDN0_9PROT|nr:UDP-N-acetylmuramoyl-L-alanine--D-glutamate ligase [Candidatus Cytomitobacter indipagum]QEK37851.1 UDP-N-acetylmuramoyl-L-alanine--D-glutamate ligase [Candidatus Cytomitobacter indipagum]